MSEGVIYNIQRMSVHDGPGIRTTVFFKGCPLRCLWCSNPESQLFTPQMMLFDNLCTSCGSCIEVCPHGAVIRKEDGICGRDTEKCTHCGACTEHCPSKARVMSGEVMSVEKILDVVRSDSLFYENSGGGVTLGGGEPTAGAGFFLDVLQALHDEAFHVAVDTCGFCPAERFDKTLALADLFLFDCKHMDAAEHKRLTGQDNVLIQRNLRAVLDAGIPVRIRMPLMPGLNDTEENIAAMAELLLPYGKKSVDVMPCHTFGRSKYLALGRPLPKVEQYRPDQLKDVLARFERHGLSPIIV